MPTAADTVRTARTRARISQSALARRAGVAQSTVSRIESDDLDPTWSTMQALLLAAGWAAEPTRTDAADLISAPSAARAITTHLRRGDEEAGIRDLTEAVGRLKRFVSQSALEVPQWVIREPHTPVPDRTWQTFLATAFAYALEGATVSIPAWMRDVPALDRETALGDDPSPEFRAWLRERTPAVFRAKNLLSRAEDWAIA
ncbi:helix-turn-helix domain-containing protein [Microcella pacifica]|uniref:Helix-turn-helix domain-containing protein n=1 Tax=Microcella pacifica TaxID=2591847 RepID=A0A9E5JL23_9MICO|nr:helix-turn-helix domain-containing protein [Microcella pacifica]NHF62384.1 helix-turn-helix domain-containing protein [Microcella pacifica]